MYKKANRSMSVWLSIFLIIPIASILMCPPHVIIIFMVAIYFLTLPSLIFNRNRRRSVQAEHLQQFFRMLAAINSYEVSFEVFPDDDYEPPDRDIDPLPEHVLGSEDIPEGYQCPICLDEMRAQDLGVVLACKHAFHGDCINRWRRSSDNCPVCRSLTSVDVD